MRIAFDCFVYDVQSGCFHGDERVPLSRLECRVLGLLVRTGGRLVMKDEFAREVWRGGVSDESISRAVHAIRRKLRGYSSARVIETLYSRGYRLAVAARPVVAATPDAGGTAESTLAVIACLRDLREPLRHASASEMGRIARQVEHVERLLAESC